MLYGDVVVLEEFAPDHWHGENLLVVVSGEYAGSADRKLMGYDVEWPDGHVQWYPASRLAYPHMCAADFA